jgi:hypothetical protein
LIRALKASALLSMAPALVAGVVLAGPGAGRAGYAPLTSVAVDTIRVKVPAQPAGRTRIRLGSAVPGYLSSWGLPPVQGQFTISDTALLFESTDGTTTSLGSRVSLAYIDRESGRDHYLFRFDAGVFESDSPGALLELARDSVWRPSLRPAGGRAPSRLRYLGSAASVREAQQITSSSYADTLYALFGRPQAAVGLIGPRGRAAGRLGEYIAGRDSLAFDPDRMTSQLQFRHAFAHELAHRWQAKARAQVNTLWKGVPAIRDPKRYGYGEASEHQAEAAAFAVNFLQATSARHRRAMASLSLLEHYELLVPGTRTMVRFLALQPIYRKHPLRSLFTNRPVKYALEK